jgi:hypothetical protein
LSRNLGFNCGFLEGVVLKPRLPILPGSQGKNVRYNMRFQNSGSFEITSMDYLKNPDDLSGKEAL